MAAAAKFLPVLRPLLRWLCLYTHQEAAFTSLSFESGFGHGACFGQLDLRECDMTKDLKITCEWGFPSPAVGDPSAAMNKPGLDSWRMRDQMGWGPISQLSQLSRHKSYVVSGHPGPAGGGIIALAVWMGSSRQHVYAQWRPEQMRVCFWAFMRPNRQTDSLSTYRIMKNSKCWSFEAINVEVDS